MSLVSGTILGCPRKVYVKKLGQKFEQIFMKFSVCRKHYLINFLKLYNKLNCYMKIIGRINAQRYHGVIDSLRFEKNSKIIKSNHGPEIGRKRSICFAERDFFIAVPLDSISLFTHG